MAVGTKKPRVSARAAADEVPAQEVDLTPQDGRQWYVIHTYSGYENKVKANLESPHRQHGRPRAHLPGMIPTEEEIEIRDGQRRMV